ncbi:N-acetyltransferase [Nocardia nova]|uniref:N-acetyltransferase n=1 Tax=Nocardia nova TaxID=37330 RepID=A0A2S6ANL6_9NOCA|nr:GNAT family N-acetyltransferase [Nocardia nova]PPJ25208.1 N-acetyltransferase [Nocardia nova]PPJ36818.1 N-acetyltransferase [Nocardia nova]
MTTRLEHNTAAGRYEIYIDDTLAGYADYAESSAGDKPIRDLNHTLTFPEFRGRGVAAQLVEYALTDCRDNGFAVVPTCWYVEQYIGDHREYADLVA